MSRKITGISTTTSKHLSETHAGKKATCRPKNAGIGWGLGPSPHQGISWPMLSSCWLIQAFRSLPEANPILILAPRRFNGLLHGLTRAWERGCLEAKNGQKKLGIKFGQLVSWKLA